MGETTEEWMRKWWGRLRIPLGLFIITGMVIRNLDQFGSGGPRGIVGAVAWIGFWAWLFFHPLAPPMSDPPTAAQMRSRSWPTLLVSGAYTGVFVLLTAWSVLDRGYVPPISLVAAAIPISLFLGSWFEYSKADSIAARRAAEARRA